MKKFLISLVCLFCGCVSLKVPNDFKYAEIQTSTFKIATWQKITDKHAPYKIYIEGDGYAFNTRGQVSHNPTPKSTLVRELAFGDKHENVIYMARPCQFVDDKAVCKPIYWSTARFSAEVIKAEYEVVYQIAGDNPVTLVGFSGGAQVAGLIAVKFGKKLQIEKLVTIAGNLDVKSWVEYHKLPPLDLSDDLVNYREQYAKYPQTHYVGLQDDNILPFITEQFVVNPQNIIKVKAASHNKGWESVYTQIRGE